MSPQSWVSCLLETHEAELSEGPGQGLRMQHARPGARMLECFISNALERVHTADWTCEAVGTEFTWYVLKKRRARIVKRCQTRIFHQWSQPFSWSWGMNVLQGLSFVRDKI